MNDQVDRSARIYGGLLIASALLSVLGALHHPRVGAHEIGEVLRILAAEAGPISGIHAALLAIFIVQYIGFCGFARALGLDRPLVLAGWVLLSLGTIAMVSAAAINGFAVPQFAANYANPAPEDAHSAAAILRFSWALNQAFAQIGAVAWGGAILLWSAALLQRRGPARWLGGAGMVVGLAISGGLAFGLLRLDVSGFLLVTALLAAWAAGGGLLLIGKRLDT